MMNEVARKQAKETSCARLFLAFLFVTVSLCAMPGSNEAALVEAVKAGEMDKVKALAAQGGRSERLGFRSAARHVAAHAGRLDILQFLVSKGANPNGKGIIWIDGRRDAFYGNTLGAAAGEGHLDVVTYLVEVCRSLPRRPGSSWRTVPRRAGRASCGQPSTGRGRCASTSCPGAEPNARDGTGKTALHWAASKGREDICDLLLAKGANPAAVDDEGITVLHEAASSGNATLCTRFIALGADPNAIMRLGLRPLHLAADQGHMEACALLLARAAPDAHTDKGLDGAPLGLPQGDQRWPAFFDQGGLRFRGETEEGDTSSHWAAFAGDEGLCNLLLERALPSGPIGGRILPLHVAALHGRAGGASSFFHRAPSSRPGRWRVSRPCTWPPWARTEPSASSSSSGGPPRTRRTTMAGRPCIGPASTVVWTWRPFFGEGGDPRRPTFRARHPSISPRRAALRNSAISS